MSYPFGYYSLCVFPDLTDNAIVAYSKTPFHPTRSYKSLHNAKLPRVIGCRYSVS